MYSDNLQVAPHQPPPARMRGPWQPHNGFIATEDAGGISRDQELLRLQQEDLARAVERHKQRSEREYSPSFRAMPSQPPSATASQAAAVQNRAWLDMSGRFAPVQTGNHTALWTLIFTLITSFIFAFMAGQYSTYQVQNTLASVAKGNSTAFNISTIAWGPATFEKWLQFYNMSPETSFDFDYLAAWGGRWGPDLNSGRWWQIITSIFLHSSFSHLLSNMVLFLILATPLENSYGSVRIFVVWLVSGLAGSLASTAWEAPCSLVVGASGAVFGFVGLYLADIILNFESMVMPMARLSAMVVGLVFLIVLQVVDSKSGNKATSHMSHVGGFIAGLFTSFLFLPNFKDRRWRLVRKQAQQQGHSLPRNWTEEYADYQSVWTKYPKLVALVNIVGFGVMVGFFVVLPIVLWKGKLVGLKC